MTKPQLTNGVYRHYKGGLYQVIGLARHSENDEWLVVYYPLYGDVNPSNLWVRPFAVFTQMVVTKDGNKPRFEPISIAQ